MKQRIQKVNATLVAIVIGTIGVVFALSQVGAAGASIYFSPASRSIVQGATTTFTVRANTGGANVDVAELAITYDTSKLEFAGVSAASSPINTPAGSSAAYKNSGNTISGSYFTLSPISGDIVLATITFKARVASGSTAVQLVSPGAGGTLIGGGGSDLGASLGSATVTFTAPPTNTPAPSNPGTGTGGAGSSTSNKPSTTTNNPSSGNTSSGNPTAGTPTGTNPSSPTDTQTEGQPILTASDLIPELKVGVFDNKNKPLRNKEVTLRSEPQTVKTDGDGFAIFKNVPLGDHTLSYEYGGTTHEMPVYVANADAQTVVFSFAQRNVMILWAILSTFVLAVAALVVVLARSPGGLNLPRIRPRGPRPPTGPLGPNGATDFAPQKDHHWHKHPSTPGMVVGGPDGVKTFTEDK